MRQKGMDDSVGCGAARPSRQRANFVAGHSKCWHEDNAEGNSICGLVVKGGFYFHPKVNDLSLGTPVEEKATWLTC